MLTVYYVCEIQKIIFSLFHPFSQIPASIVLPELFNCPFCYTPHPLAIIAVDSVRQYLTTRADWADELSQGKMFGVLVVRNADGQLGFLAAFSGNIGGRAQHSYFVPPIYDITVPDGYFRTEERSISEINHQISALENDESLRKAEAQLSALKKQAETEIAQAKAAIRMHKSERDAMRCQALSDERQALLIRQSQHEKAELKRLERRWAAEIADVEAKTVASKEHIYQLKELRRQKSEQLQAWLFEQYVVLNARGESKTVRQIFAEERGTEPPAATGECAAPKLLQAAYRNGFRPVTMAEFWWGQSPEGEIRRHGEFYPACHSKCGPLLNFMLKGLDVEPNRQRQKPDTELKIIYNDQWIAAIDKPAGLPSVPGKEHTVSVYSIVKEMFPESDGPLVAHRLDMDTSGILLIAKTEQVFVSLQRQFALRQMKKRYVALLEGLLESDSGTINLPLCPNINDRPRQMVDYEHGKPAITRFTVISRANGRTAVNFFPETGRTHQLRVHAAHQSGLNSPIVGDNLYGKPAERLMLHAAEITFTHPVTGVETIITSEVPFKTE